MSNWLALQLLFLTIMASIGSDNANSIDTIRRLKGIPSINSTNEGNKFCFSFFQNHEENTINILGIYIATQENEDVEYSIKSKINGVARNGTVKPGQISKELYQYTSYSNFETDSSFNPPRVKGMVPLRLMSDTGIIVETVDSSHKITVMGFSDGAETSDGFTAVPIVDMSNIISIDYQYSVFTAGGKEESSIAAITTCDDLEAENVTINTTSVSQGTFLPFNGSTITFRSYYTSVITGSDDLISSINVIAPRPIGFMTGHECGQVPTDQVGCDHLIEQVPPSYTWGYNFLTVPFHTNNFGYVLKLLPGKDFGTNFKIFCTINTTVTVESTVENFVRTDRHVANKGIFNITTQSYCTIQSNKPLAVMQYATSHRTNDSNSVLMTSVTIQNLGDPAMVWVPAVSQYLNKYLITNYVSIRSQSFTSNGIYVTVLPHCFNASAILDNGIPLENNANNWDTFHCDDVTDICGYGVSVDISQGTHLIKHNNSSCSFGAIMFGWGYKKGYAYPAGFGMKPIGGTFYSIEPLISSTPESGLVSVTVYRSGDVSEASSVQVGTFMSSKSNAAKIGEDLENQTKTIQFAANEFLATVNFTFMDDFIPEQDEVFDVKFVNDHKINIGTSQEVELTILGDTRLITGNGGNPETGPNVVAQEGDSQVKVCIKLSGLTDSSYPEPVEFFFTPMEKSEALQPAQEEDYDNTTIAVIMPPGDTEVCAHISIVKDTIFDEPNEQFCINVTSNVSVGIFHPAECQITVTIIDEMGISTLGIRGSININRRLKGVPKSSTTEGNKFCFSFFEPHVSTVFLIKIGTLEDFPVQYHISSGVNGINKTNTVQPRSINTEQYQYIPPGNVEGRLEEIPVIVNMTVDFFNNRSINDFTGIEIKTINSSHTISVTCFSKSSSYYHTEISFVAVPLFNVGSITQQYNYSIFDKFVDFYVSSQTVAAIVVCDTIKAGGVSLTYSNASIPGDYFGTYDERGVRSSQIKFEKYYTPSISSLPLGTDVYAIQPIGFMFGHACVSGYTFFCDYLIKQIPPSYTWGYNFLIGGQSYQPQFFIIHSKILKFFPGKEIGTNFKIFCTNSTSMTINEPVQNFTKTDHMVLSKGIFHIGYQDYCTVQSNKPLAVMLYYRIFSYGGPSSTMIWIPPVSQYLNRYLVAFDSTSYSTDFTVRNVHVTVYPHCFDASAILDNGIALENNAFNWHTFHCDKNTDICGYGVSVNIPNGIHLLYHTDPSCSFGAIMFELEKYGKANAYSAGFGMRPIGVTFYSIEPLISSAPESGLVSVNVCRSGDVSEASAVQVGTFMSSKSNAATIGEDLENQTKTIKFSANEFSVTVNFSFLSDSISELDEVFLVGFLKNQNINIGTPSEVELTILGVESNIIKFTADNYCVHEGNASVYVCVNKSRDTVDSVKLEITAMEDSTQSAEDIFDFVAETKTITFPGSSTQVCAQFQIIKDPFVDFKEPIETFCVNFTATGPLGGGQMTATDKSVVTISESLPEIIADSISGANSVFAPESQENVTVCINRTFNFSCTRSVTFRAIDSALSINAKSGSDFVAEIIEVPFTSNDSEVCATFMILNDDIVEKNESFLINVIAPDHIPTMLKIKITITDEDDAAVIKFSNDTYTFPESIEMDALVCVKTTKVLSDDISIKFGTRSSDVNSAATADLDYISKFETKTLRNGSRAVCYNIEIQPDVTREPTEFFYVEFEVLNLVELMDNNYYGLSRLNVSNSEPAVVYIRDTSVTGCESVYADLVLLISESSSMEKNQFTMVKDLAGAILNQLPIGKNTTHAGIVRLSNSNRTQVISPLGNVTDLKQLKQIVRNISVDDEDNRGLATHLTYSMNLAINEIEERGRLNSRKIFAIITDGLHSHEPSSYDSARMARELGYDIFAVRFFTNSSLSNWEKLTGYKERVLFLSTFNSSQSEKANFFISQICKNIIVDSQLLNTIGEKKIRNVGGTVSFNCTADGVPAPDIVWRKDGKYIIPQANRRKTSSSNLTDGFRINEIPQAMQRTSELIITDLTVSDTGSYSCRADNGVDKGAVLTIPYHLTVEGFSKTNFCLNSPCKNHGTCQSLASTYICNCPETHTGSNCQERVRVTVGPKIIEFHHPVTNQLYSSVSFTCKAIGSPAPSIHWYKDNKLINITDPSLLMFNDLSLKDRGVYHCEARSVINGVNVSVNTTKVLLNIEDVLQYVAVMSLTDDFYDYLNDSELINGTIQQLVEEINYNLSGRIIGNSNLFFVELLNIQEIDPDYDPENVSLLITLIANNQTNQHTANDLGNLLGLTITDVVRFDGCPTSSTTILSDSGDPKLALTIKWPEANIGKRAVVNCPCGSNDMSAGGTLNASRYCGGDFANGAMWQKPFVKKCNLSDLARRICQLKDRLFSHVSVIDMVEELKAITNGTVIGSTEVVAVVSVLETAAEFTNEVAGNTMLITSMFEVIDNLLAVNQETLIESQALSNSSSRILAIVSEMAAIINITNASSHVVKSHSYFAVSIRENNFEGFGNQTLSINLTDFSESNVNSYNITLETERNIVSSTGSVTLPSNIFNSSNINRITNAVFLTDSLFLRRRLDYFNVSSVVISTSILRELDAIKELESPVNLSFQLNPTIKGSFPQCVFWDQSLNSGYGDWSSDNCNTSYDSVTQAIKCFCNHLTSFAVMQDVSPTEPSIEVNVYYLDSVSYIGIIITIICLIITVVFYLYNKDLRISNHCHILLNLCFALIGLYLSFITSIHTRNVNSFCALSGFVLQFFFLVCLSLMSAEAIDLYINIVINSNKKFFHLKVTLVSWIAPIFIVIFCFSPSYMNYINDSSNFCRAFDTPFYIGMVIPFIIAYSFIWIVFIIIIISLLMSSRINNGNKKKVLKPSYKYQLATLLIHSTLFCLSSVLMLLMTEDTFTNKAIRDLVASLFVLLTGCHGLFLFVVHCLCTKEFYHICKKFLFGIKSLSLHTVRKKPSPIDRNETVTFTNQYLETKLNTNISHDNSSSHLEQLLVKYSISASQINLQEAVGQGEFGIVYRALLATGKDVPQVVAVKTLKGLFSRSDVASIVEESLIMSNFDHPNVLSLIGVSLDLGPAPCIIMPYMSRGSLLSYLKNDRLNITITDVKDEEIILNVRKHLLTICLQVANGMCYLASQYFVHRDLAARNCMIDNNGVIKVADFGLSEEVYTKTYFNQFKDKNEAESVKLPIKWMAIESIHDGIFSEKSDVWSYGVLCWEVFNGGKTPFPGLDPAGVIELLDTGGRLNCPHNDACSDTIYELMLSCWYESPNDRPLFSELNTSINALINPLAQYLSLQL